MLLVRTNIISKPFKTYWLPWQCFLGKNLEPWRCWSASQPSSPTFQPAPGMKSWVISVATLLGTEKNPYQGTFESMRQSFSFTLWDMLVFWEGIFLWGFLEWYESDWSIFIYGNNLQMATERNKHRWCDQHTMGFPSSWVSQIAVPGWNSHQRSFREQHAQTKLGF